MFAVQLHEAPSWILGRNREKTSAHRRKLSDKLPPRQFPFWHKVKVLHLPAPLKGVESSSRKSGHFALIWGVFCSVEVLRLVLHFSGVTHVLRCSVFVASGVRTGQSERSVPLGAWPRAHLGVILLRDENWCEEAKYRCATEAVKAS